MDENDPIGGLARELVRLTGGADAAERFDDALEEYGPQRAMGEAAIGVTAGLLHQAALRQSRRRAPEPPGATVDAPLVEGEALDEDDPGAGYELTIDVPHDALEVSVDDEQPDVLWLHEAHQSSYVDLPIPVGAVEWVSEPGRGVSMIAVRPAGDA